MLDCAMQVKDVRRAQTFVRSAENGSVTRDLSYQSKGFLKICGMLAVPYLLIDMLLTDIRNSAAREACVLDQAGTGNAQLFDEVNVLPAIQKQQRWGRSTW